ncbi:MAG: PTS sugar transporter subunit IIA, partial [Paraburkholderia graminis]
MERHSNALARRTQATFSPVNMNRLAKFLPLENVVVGLSVT